MKVCFPHPPFCCAYWRCFFASFPFFAAKMLLPGCIMLHSSKLSRTTFYPALRTLLPTGLVFVGCYLYICAVGFFLFVLIYFSLLSVSPTWFNASPSRLCGKAYGGETGCGCTLPYSHHCPKSVQQCHSFQLVEKISHCCHLPCTARTPGHKYHHTLPVLQSFTITCIMP